VVNARPFEHRECFDIAEPEPHARAGRVQIVRRELLHHHVGNESSRHLRGVVDEVAGAVVVDEQRLVDGAADGERGIRPLRERARRRSARMNVVRAPSRVRPHHVRARRRIENDVRAEAILAVGGRNDESAILEMEEIGGAIDLETAELRIVPVLVAAGVARAVEVIRAPEEHERAVVGVERVAVDVEATQLVSERIRIRDGDRHCRCGGRREERGYC
jgi:hypothetical protein